MVRTEILKSVAGELEQEEETARVDKTYIKKMKVRGVTRGPGEGKEEVRARWLAGRV